jgi:hypothetical protein
MGARLESHVESATASLFGGLPEGDHFGVGTAELPMEPLAGESALAVDYDSADHRIWGGTTPTTGSKLERTVHPAMVGIAPAGERV